MTAYQFWKLVWLLPMYEGAVKAHWAASPPKVVTDARAEKKAKQGLPLKPGEVEVSLAGINTLVGDPMISFGKG